MGAKKILIVEDEDDIREITRHILEKNGYEVIEAANGEEGLKAYAASAPDLVLLDVHLPDMLGFEICRKIRAEGPRAETPIILCTVRSEVSPVAEGLAAGATDYILKPFEVEDLLNRIETALTAVRKEG